MQNKIEFNSPRPIPQKLEEGQFWEIDEDPYVLALIDGEYALVNLRTGIYWNGPYKRIEDVFGTLNQSCFTLITQPFTVAPGV